MKKDKIVCVWEREKEGDRERGKEREGKRERDEWRNRGKMKDEDKENWRGRMGIILLGTKSRSTFTSTTSKKQFWAKLHSLIRDR